MVNSEGQTLRRNGTPAKKTSVTPKTVTISKGMNSYASLEKPGDANITSEELCRHHTPLQQTQEKEKPTYKRTVPIMTMDEETGRRRPRCSG